MALAEGSEQDWWALLRIAGAFWLTGALAWRFREHGLTANLPAAVRDYADGAAELATLRALEQCRQVRRVALRLNDAGITPVVLKGTAAHLTRLYPDPGIRLCSDIDLLVPPAQLPEAVSVLRRAGYSEMETEPEGLDASRMKHHPRLSHPEESFGVDLHQYAVDIGFRSVLNTEAILADAAILPGERNAMLLPSLDHRISHCILHLMADYRAGRHVALRQLLELRQLALHGGAAPDWPRIAGSFRQAGHRAAFEHALILAKQFVALPLPPIDLGLEARLLAVYEKTLFASGLGMSPLPGMARLYGAKIRRHGLWYLTARLLWGGDHRARISRSLKEAAGYARNRA